jgi:CheY-like chemotaxis protein
MKLARGNAEILEQARAMMERQVAHMVALVDDLLDLSRISRGQISMNKERVDLASIVSTALDTCEATIRAARQELNVSLPPEPVWVHGDAVRLAQVLTNLLGNASKYSDTLGRISLTLEVRDGDAQITVSDTGVGIPAHMLSRVFDMFTQVDASTERALKGLGIGLTVVKRLAEMHGGTVEARSEGRDRGSQFIVRLPIDASGPEQAHEPPSAVGASAKGRRVLVVDDNRDAALTLAMMLRLMGSAAEVAHGGLEAVELGEAFRPELVLMDIGMPGVSGHAAAKLVRERPWGRSVRLVAVTGLGREDDRCASREAGFDDHLVKPVEPRDLEALLASLD